MTFNPLEIIKKDFRFLEEEFDFVETHEQYSPEIMGNAQVIYKSDSVAISIVVDRSQVLINIGLPTWPEREWFEFTNVVHFFNPTLAEVYYFPDNIKDINLEIDIQARRLATILRENCMPILKGNFSMAQKIKEIENEYERKLLAHLKSLSPEKKNKKN